MRKITKEITEAFLSGKSKSIGNTKTDGSSIWLHNNKIVSYLVGTDKLIFTLAGWNTTTTRERINGVLSKANKPTIYQKNFKAMRENIEIPSNGWLTA